MRTALMLVLLAAFLAVPVAAQIPGTLGFDFAPGNPTFTGTGGAVDDDDSAIDADTTVANGATFGSLVRLNGTTDLLGVSFDFSFPTAQLNVVEIRETRFDLDFSGEQDFAEVNDIVEFFLATLGTPMTVDQFSYSYNDGTGDITTNPGVLIDPDDDSQLSFAELDGYIGEFLANLGGTDVPFWTEVVSRRTGFNESVEVSDTVAAINQTGVAEDNTVVLLARPENVVGGTRPDFGFDGDAILFEVVWRAVGTGVANITVSNAVGIDESFTTVPADVQPIANVVNSVVTGN